MNRPMLRSLLLSLALHAIFAVPIGFTLGSAAAARTDVVRGVSSIELQLVPASAVAASLQQEKGPSAVPASRQTAWLNDNGATMLSRPSSLGNSAPRYPWSARVNGWQGTVSIRARVNSKGRVGALEVGRSSGYPVLDSAALEAIRRWEFIPARQGSRKVASTIEIPITFLLKDE